MTPIDGYCMTNIIVNTSKISTMTLNRNPQKLKGEGRFYIYYSAVSSLLDRSERFPLFKSLTDLFNPTPFHSGSILARQQLRAKTKSLTFPPLSIARYSFIQLSQRGRQTGDLNPGSLDCESGVLRLSYRAGKMDLV